MRKTEAKKDKLQGQKQGNNEEARGYERKNQANKSIRNEQLKSLAGIRNT